MNTTEAMRKVTGGELCEFSLRDGRIVSILDKPTNGRVKIAILTSASASDSNNVQEVTLRDLRNVFDTVGFADALPAYRPQEHATNGFAYGALKPGRVCFSVTEDMISAPTVNAIEEVLRILGIDTSALCWRLDSPDGTLLTKIGRLAAQQGKPGFDTGEIGNIISRGTLKRGDYWIDITDKFDWQSGQFGDEGSCYWGSRAAARPGLQKYGAYAIRFFTPDWQEGMGRAWIAPTGDGGCVVFNVYGDVKLEEDGWGMRGNLENVAAVLSLLTGSTGKRVKLTNYGTETGTVWINNASGFRLGGTSRDNSVDLEVDTEDEEEGYTCCNCGAHIEEYEAFFTDNVVDDGPYCEYCYMEMFFRCDACERDFDRDDERELVYRDRWMRYATHHTVCPDCFELHGGEYCYECGEVISTQVDNYTHDNDGSIYCERCAEVYLRQCAGCGEYDRTRNMDIQHGEYICSNCVRLSVVPCYALRD